ncbi:MAG TPA: hypothetical protein DCW90_00255 [Lachnospiraceae bacterium]|nr:hypothetical protein [Lachnospiraceae bacterium]
MSSFLNTTDKQISPKKICDGVLHRFFFQNRDIDVILTSKNDETLKEYLKTLDTSLEERVNQNAFSKFTVGDVDIIASNATDEIVIVPENGMKILGDKDKKTITFSIPNASDETPGLLDENLAKKLASIEWNANAYEHPTYPNVPPGENYLRVSVDEFGHVYAASKTEISIAEGGTGATTAEKARENLGAASTDVATSEKNGLLSSEMFSFIQDLITNGLKPTPIPVSYIHSLFGFDTEASS